MVTGNIVNGRARVLDPYRYDESGLPLFFDAGGNLIMCGSSPCGLSQIGNRFLFTGRSTQFTIRVLRISRARLSPGARPFHERRPEDVRGRRLQFLPLLLE